MTDPKQSSDYKNLVDLLAVYNEASARLETLQAELRTSYIDVVDGARSRYAELQATLTETEAAIEAAARAHPEWFGDTRSVRTPYGSVNFRSSTELVADNEEVSIVLIEKGCDSATAEKYVRQEKKLNLENLRDLTDAELRAFRIKRVPKDNFSVKPSTIDLGKAVKAAEKAEARKKKEAA